MSTKPFYQSTTFWFSALYLVIELAGAVGYTAFQPSPEVQQLGVALVILLNIGAMFLRKQRLSFSPPDQRALVRGPSDWW